MRFEVKVPTVGESITEGILAEWKVADGAFVQAEEPLFELETDKVSMTVLAEQAGRISIVAKPGSTVTIGSAVATIETDAAPAEAPAPATAAESAPPLHPTAGKETLKANLADLSPSVRRIVAEENLDPSKIAGTGKGGRITKEDALKAALPPKAPAASIPSDRAETLPPLEPELQTPNSKPQTRTTRHPMSLLRQRIAERLVASQHNSATLTTFNEVDMSAVMALRAKFQDEFVKLYGVKLGIMSFFVKATIEALRSVPAVNSQIDGDAIVENHFYDIGVAVSTDRGLVVPVIRNADALGFGELEREIARYAEKARSRTLTLDELQGGVFTVSNGGVFGSMLSTPILNPPQAAILGLHGIKKRPVVVGDDDRIEVRPMMYLALSYDHRLIDGRESVTFLKRIVECIEAPERMMVGV